MKTKSIAIAAGVVTAAVLLCKKNKSVSGISGTNWYLAKELLDEKGIDLSKDFYALSFSDLYQLPEIAKRAKYKAPSAKYRNGSPGRYFWYAMQRKFNY